MLHEVLTGIDSVSQVRFHSISRGRTLKLVVGLRSGWPVGWLGHAPMCVAHMDVGRLPLVGVQQRTLSPSVADESLIYPRYVGMLLNS